MSFDGNIKVYLNDLFDNFSSRCLEHIALYSLETEVDNGLNIMDIKQNYKNVMIQIEGYQ